MEAEMKLDRIARSRPWRMGAAVLAASAAGAALLAAGPAMTMGEPPQTLMGLDACRFGDFGCGHGFGCFCHLVVPPSTVH
jgi:hypothetical protein